MQKRPLIGVPTQSLHSMPGVPVDLPASSTMSHRYIQTLAEAGALPFMVPLLSEDEGTLRGLYEALDGVFLPGGADLDPASYDQTRLAFCDRSDPPRDQLELTLVRWALEDGKPVLGVCRGLQILNVAAGGTLYQDITQQMTGAVKHDYFPGQGHARDYLAHDVRLTAPGSWLGGLCAPGSMMVNSLHHQGIDRLGDGLLVTAVAPDGLVEAVEVPGEGLFAVAVQWHPEVLYQNDPCARALFDAFVTEAAEFRGAGAESGIAAELLG